MARRKVETAPSSPLGTLTAEQRAAEIAARQNQALAASAPAAEGTPMDTGGGGWEDPERAAIQEEGSKTSALSASFFGKTTPAATTAAAIPSQESRDEDVLGGSSEEEITYTAGEEMYGKQGTFSSYRVGPITLRTRLRPRESHGAAYARLRADATAMMASEREVKDAEFKAHFKKAFG